MSWFDECDLEYLIGDLKDKNAKLRNEVELTKRMCAKVSEDLCAEKTDNERLRQELAICEESEQEKCIEHMRQENIDWEDRYRELAKENAKLRKLVRELWEGYADPPCEGCPLRDTPTCADCPICAREAAVIDHMCELGIEVK